MTINSYLTKKAQERIERADKAYQKSKVASSKAASRYHAARNKEFRNVARTMIGWAYVRRHSVEGIWYVKVTGVTETPYETPELIFNTIRERRDDDYAIYMNQQMAVRNFLDLYDQLPLKKFFEAHERAMKVLKEIV